MAAPKAPEALLCDSDGLSFSLQGPCLCLGSELVVVQLAFPGTKENSSLWIPQEFVLVITSSLGQEYCGLGCQLLATSFF